MLSKLRRGVWIGLFVCLVAGWGYIAFHASHKSPHQQAVNQGTRGAKSAPPQGATPKSAEERIADYTWWLGAFTFALVVVSTFQIFFLTRADETARIAANAARDSADAAREAFVADHRPWISIEPRGGGDLTYDGNGNARFTAKFVLRNHGNSPAMRVRVFPKMLANGPRYSEAIEQRKLCEPIRGIPDEVPLFTEHTLFPGQIIPYDVGLMIACDEIKTSMQPAQEEATVFWPSIVGCVSYEFAFQKGRHLTEFRLHVRRRNLVAPNLPLGFETKGGDVPERDVLIYRTLLGGNGAD
jgi:hypothetical protein